MKGYQDAHDLTQSQATRSIAKLESTSQKLLLPFWFKALAKIIDGAKEFF
jgi:hypothetical protein